ncbi:MAG TPA: MFS transporter [Polyangiaceae bacterium]|nr:MFS transporter [Polyangiaceae bacterium]
MPSATFRALRHRNFQLFFGGQLVSLVGTWMQNVAQSWLIYRLTHAPLLLGLVGFAGQAPIFLLATVGGAVADRRARRGVLVATQTASMVLAFALAALTLLGVVRPWHVFVLAAALGTVNAFDIPTRQAFVVEMVGKEDLGNAIALNSSIFNGARVVGPAVAGLLVAVVGEGWCFFGNAVSFIAVIASLLAMSVPERVLPPPPENPLAHAAEGIRYVARTPEARAIMLLLGMVALSGIPYVVLMPIFAAEVLHGGPKALGTLMGATGGGALVGALLLAARSGVHGMERLVHMSATVFGMALVFFAASRTMWLSVALLVPAGAGLIVQNATSNTLIQEMVPDELRGRVMAVYAMVFMGMAPLGALLAGAFAQRVGAPWTVAGGGLLCTAAAQVFAISEYGTPCIRSRSSPSDRTAARRRAPPSSAGPAPS